MKEVYESVFSFVFIDIELINGLVMFYYHSGLRQEFSSLSQSLAKSNPAVNCGGSVAQ